ncbi:hypothetical protein [Polyangium mundeleinium]|uniref:Lipoprotein n=1 Tax=Polyangium mundeleinium TaxID=2995306 RepID=A0ABT5ELR7_9BACT|nr:hypothetical protein [Polyangium mundeleinium]MDC0742790.1 hypothetical protein [Polyangium mundeleinium]
MGRALRLGFGLSLVAAFALVNGCASGDVDDASDPSVDPSRGEATENLVARPPVGQWACTTGGGLLEGVLVAYAGGRCDIFTGDGGDTTYCVGRDFRTCPDCMTLARNWNCLF